MTELVYLTDSYKKTARAVVTSVEKKGNGWEIQLDKTIFYPVGGGQPSDKGYIQGPHGRALVKHARMHDASVIHEASLEGELHAGDHVQLEIDWPLRYSHMKQHSAGHIVHEAVISLIPRLHPIKGEHGNSMYIEYTGSISPDMVSAIERKANEIVDSDIHLNTEMVTLEELKKRSPWVPNKLPTNKPLRVLQIEGFLPIPDGGTQVRKTAEVGHITIEKLAVSGDVVQVHYSVSGSSQETQTQDSVQPLSSNGLIPLLIELEQQAVRDISHDVRSKTDLQFAYLGQQSEFSKLSRQMKLISKEERNKVGIILNQVKQNIEQAIAEQGSDTAPENEHTFFDVTAPGIWPPIGHTHIVSQAISEITRIFERISFTRVRHPEVDWDWYTFESLNMPPSHPARDEWETFFIENPKSEIRNPKQNKFTSMVLTPHTSNGQVREMEKGKLPIRMINIAKCYRRQSDISHVPMFHQFEGLYVDKNVSIGQLKGVLTYFVTQFFGPERTIRLRPFHFQFTEPSFEIDITCGICLGKTLLPNGQKCRLCKEGWLELGGTGMVHPTVLTNGGIDASQYNGFAFGWGVERTFMMKSGTQLDDIRLLYGNDVRFLEQF